MPSTRSHTSTRSRENGGRVPQAVKDAVEEYAKGLESRSDMSDEAREEAIRHYQAGLMKFHKAD